MVPSHHRISVYRCTHHWAWYLFLPERRSFSPDRVVLMSHLTFGATLGWFGFSICLLHRPERWADRERQAAVDAMAGVLD